MTKMAGRLARVEMTCKRLKDEVRGGRRAFSREE